MRISTLTFEGQTPSLAPDRTAITIQTERLTWKLEVDAERRLRHVSFGNQTELDPNWPVHELYPAAGSGWILEPALRAVHANGDTSTDLRYIAHRVQEVDANVTLTEIQTKDPVYPFFVTHWFRSYREENVVEHWTEIRHEESGPVRLTAYASSGMTLPPDEYYVTQFHGDWGREMTMAEEKLGYGIKILDTKLGVRAHQFRQPGFLLAKGGPAREKESEIIGGTLAWPSNFQFLFEMNAPDERAIDNQLHVRAGMNPYAADYQLPPNEVFKTPAMIWSYSTTGAGDLSRQMHRWGRRYGLREGDRTRATLLNNWEATFFDFDDKKIVSLFDGAASLGIELFLLDDGWFGIKYPRNDDSQGLGDWAPNPAKFPNGMEVVAQEALKRGIRFGIWIEPEMINPRSELYEAHPDWVVRQASREPLLRRNQMVLDLTNPEVEAYVFKLLDDLLTQNPSVSFVKWDSNRYINQPGSAYLAPEHQSHLFVDFGRAVLRIFERLAAAHPKVDLMICSGGGARADYGTLRHAHEFWASDMTDPVHRVRIQWGYSQLFPTIAVAAHVTRWGKRPLKFAIDVALSGRFGMDIDVDKMTEEEKAVARLGVATAKQIREVVHFGDLYRLESPYAGPRASLVYASQDKSRAIVFVYPLKGTDAGLLKLEGLEYGRSYTVRELNLAPDAPRRLSAEGKRVTGAELMENGLSLPALGEMDSLVIEFSD